MARMPDAKWRPVARKGRYRMRSPKRVNVHVAVSNTRSLWSYFNRGGNPDSHFYVLRDGLIEQYVDTDEIAYCDLEGTPDTISIETQGGVSDPNGEEFTQAQAESIARIYAWAVEVHRVPLRVAVDSRPGESSFGLSWHRLGVDGNFPQHYPLHGRKSGGMKYSKSRGKPCPGTAKIQQIPGIFAEAKLILAGDDLPALTQPTTPQEDDTVIHFCFEASPDGGKTYHQYVFNPRDWTHRYVNEKDKADHKAIAEATGDKFEAHWGKLRPGASNSDRLGAVHLLGAYVGPEHLRPKGA